MTTVAHVQKFKGHMDWPSMWLQGGNWWQIEETARIRLPATTSREIGGHRWGQGTSDCTIRPHLRQSGLNGRGPMRTPPFKVNHKKKKKKKKRDRNLYREAANLEALHKHEEYKSSVRKLRLSGRSRATWLCCDLEWRLSEFNYCGPAASGKAAIFNVWETTTGSQPSH